MKLFAGLGFVAIAGGGVYFFASPRPADVFPMAVTETYQLLATAKFDAVENGGTALLQTTSRISGNGADRISWNEGTMSCDVTLTPLPDDTEQTHVNVTCKRGTNLSHGAAAGMDHNMRRNAIIEKIDAALTGRQPDRKRIAQTAARWPGDGVDGSLGTAVGTAIKMDADMQRMQVEGGEFRKREQASAAANAEIARDAAVQREERQKALGNFNGGESRY